MATTLTFPMRGTAGPTLAQLLLFRSVSWSGGSGVPKQLMTNQTRNPDVTTALFAPEAERRRFELDRSSASGTDTAHVGQDQT